MFEGYRLLEYPWTPELCLEKSLLQGSPGLVDLVHDDWTAELGSCPRSQSDEGLVLECLDDGSGFHDDGAFHNQKHGESRTREGDLARGGVRPGFDAIVIFADSGSSLQKRIGKVLPSR